MIIAPTVRARHETTGKIKGWMPTATCIHITISSCAKKFGQSHELGFAECANASLIRRILHQPKSGRAPASTVLKAANHSLVGKSRKIRYSRFREDILRTITTDNYDNA